MLRAGCLWRIIVEEHVILTDRDDAQWFGLKTPVDAALEAKRILSGKQIETVEVAEGTADVRIRLTDGLLLELLNDSSGYEPWGFSSKQVELIATGQGDVFATKAPEK